jgi:hypothetical protein
MKQLNNVVEEIHGEGRREKGERRRESGQYVVINPISRG